MLPCIKLWKHYTIFTYIKNRPFTDLLAIKYLYPLKKGRACSPVKRERKLRTNSANCISQHAQYNIVRIHSLRTCRGEPARPLNVGGNKKTIHKPYTSLKNLHQPKNLFAGKGKGLGGKGRISPSPRTPTPFWPAS